MILSQLSTGLTENTGDSICRTVALRSQSSKPLPPTARILSYLSSAQQTLTGESQENIRKQIIIIFTLNSGTYNTPGKHRRPDRYYIEWLNDFSLPVCAG